MSGLEHRTGRGLRRTVLRGCAASWLLLGGCAEAPPPRTLAEELAARALPLELADPLRVDDEMRRWVRTAVAPATVPDERLPALLDALLTRPEGPFRYRRGVTTGVREAWATGLANCLTFSHLFVALARELGHDAYYLRVREITGFDRVGDLVVVSDHVTAAAGEGAERRVLDFSDRPLRAYLEVERLDDLRALALHYSNLGAERIRAGDAAGGLEPLAWATRIDPALADGWVNLGVARRRTGDLAGAEEAYRRALAADPDQVPAYHNLAVLLERRGRASEAAALLAAASRAGLRNPWSALALGGIALRQGRLEEAGLFFRRARRLLPESADPWAALAEWALAAGDAERARRFAERALRVQPGHLAAGALLERLAAER